jgi:hypothetical protein
MHRILQTSTKDIGDGYTNHFLYKIGHKKDAAISAEYLQYKEILLNWARRNEVPIPETDGLDNFPKLWLTQQLKGKPLYVYIEDDGKKYPVFSSLFI